jgi:indole-3-glycerol phosphate synthase
MTYLDDLLAATTARVAELKQVVKQEALEQRIASAASPRGFRAAVQGPGTAVIAEIKRRSPSKGPLNEDLNPRELAGAYARGGAAAISVLTEPDYFGGSMEDLKAASEIGLPVLRKDFLIDPFQVFEARAWGADAVLVIVRILDDDLRSLVRTVEVLGMDAVVEVFDKSDLDRALDAGATTIGINHRDLATFELDRDRTAKLAPRIPDDRTIVALSGVSSLVEVEGLASAGADAVLVGESAVIAPDPEAMLAELTGRQR